MKRSNKSLGAVFLLIFALASAAVIPAEHVSAETAYAVPSKASADSKQIKAAESEIKKALNKFETEITLKAEIPVSEISPLFYDILIKNEQYFYVSSNITYTYSTTTNFVKTVNFNYVMSQNDVRKNRSAFNKNFKSYMSGIDRKWTDVQKCLYIHDKLAVSCQYDTAFQSQSYTPYGSIVNGTAVCQGYSFAYALIMNKLGIECSTIYSTADNHMWNRVKLGDNWYNIDVTYDDPLPDITNQAYHNCFMKSGTAIKKDKRHNMSSAEENVVKWGTDYDSAFWDSITQVMPSNGKNIYYITKDGKINAYDVTSKKNSVIHTISDTWKIYGTNSFYEGIFSTCDIGGKKLYFNTSDSIYSITLSNNTVKNEKTISTKDGCIYGVKVDKNKVFGLVRSDPYNTKSEKWVQII